MHIWRISRVIMKHPLSLKTPVSKPWARSEKPVRLDVPFLISDVRIPQNNLVQKLASMKMLPRRSNYSLRYKSASCSRYQKGWKDCDKYAWGDSSLCIWYSLSVRNEQTNHPQYFDGLRFERTYNCQYSLEAHQSLTFLWGRWSMWASRFLLINLEVLLMHRLRRFSKSAEPTMTPLFCIWTCRSPPTKALVRILDGWLQNIPTSTVSYGINSSKRKIHREWGGSSDLFGKI